MGFGFHGKKTRDVDKERHLKRMHKTTPFIESPLQGADQQALVFSQRHEANTIELFFDLFFVANLSTFTTYHSITDISYLAAYVGFFGILWCSWFQVTLHDVRFARDSIYERVCKTIQFIVFVGLALVGSSFNPGKIASNTNFRILCYTLVISRSLLMIQYIVVLVFTMKEKYSKLYLPLGLMIAIYGLAASAFGAMTPAFRENDFNHEGVYVIWYIVMLLECIGVITISCCWRMLSFKKTHLMERMSLLTLIVIGEGAIGVTKTVTRIMGKSGLDPEGCILIMCIILILMLLWALYFDHFPHGHYGTIRQQIWSCLHFPFQLAIVGLVEGSQQVAIARYVMKTFKKIEKDIVKICHEDHLDGKPLRDALMKVLTYFAFEKKSETADLEGITEEWIWAAGNTTGICSAANATIFAETGEWTNEEIPTIMVYIWDGVYEMIGMKIPREKMEKEYAVEIALDSWKVVYLYYWISFCTLIACSIAFLILIRRHKADVFDFVSIIIRLIALAIGGSLIAIISNNDALYSAIGSPVLLPVVLILLFLILFFDKISATFCNWRLEKSGQPYALEAGAEHDHDDHGHGGAHEHDESSESLVPDHRGQRKSAAWSIHGMDMDSDRVPLTQKHASYSSSTEYGGGQSYAMSPLMSPPMLSPPMVGHGVGQQHHEPPPGGYQPVVTSQTYGA
ncbi:hypothetical protein K504DRAFT_479868 [Pleomassaria siparia CBS 279.74]|uniref:Low temperature requirement A n=1 Tax=Pleomassaria siparia CBS 279.74 TaxID=1314801 RepID=A0A6G1KH54_9PLEO|nr:hypothetical protein K504DRAFT_479868 [Pleomassaria siparia CBS 279.74]